MSDPIWQVRRVAIFEWPITVLAGIFLCAATLSSPQVIRSHGIIILVVTMIAVTGIVQNSARGKGLNRSPKTAKLLTMLTVCVVTSSVLWLAGILSSVFIAGVFCVTQICSINTYTDINRSINGTALTLGVSAILILGLGVLTDLTLEIVVLLMCLVSLVFALIDHSFRSPRVSSYSLPHLRCFSISNTVDLWIAAIILPPSQVILYYATRLATFLLPSILHGFEIWIASAIFRTYQLSMPTEFVHAMARVNLSFFLVAAAVAVVTSTFHSVALVLLFNMNGAGAPATYLLLAAFVPTALGQSAIATQLLLSPKIQVLAHMVGVGCAAVLLASRTTLQANDLALAYLVFQTTIAIVQCVHMIKRHRIWPGPTALFAKQIRLLG